MCFASILDNSSSWELSEAFMPEGFVVGSCGLLHLLSPRSALGIMAHISAHGLERLLKVRSRFLSGPLQVELLQCECMSC